jgi:long-chain acyl-CoA synthetase
MTTTHRLDAQHRLIHDFLEVSAAEFPHATAIVHDAARTSYRELNRMANCVATWLRTEGLAHGDRVVLLLANGKTYAAVYFGILKCGGVAVPLSTDIKPGAIPSLIAELDAQLFVTSYRFERMLKTINWSSTAVHRLLIDRPRLDWRKSALSVVSLKEVLESSDGGHPRISLNPDALAVIIYTSGSTGRPKGVMLTHRNIVSNTHAICQYLNLTHRDIQMVVLPFFYVMGQSLLNTHMAVGGTVVINNRFAYPADVLNQMVSENVTGFSGVPSTYAHLLHRSPLKAYRDRLTSLRYCSQAGGHMPQHVKSELREALPEHTLIYIMYGATEASARLTYLEPGQFAARPDSIGKPISGVTLKVIGPDGKEVPPGQTGEIVARGPNITNGYWRDPESTAAVLDEWGYHTGDIGYMDDEGFYYVHGRKDNILKVGGRRISTQEIEDALAATGLVVDAAVFGFPDRLLGHRLAAILAPKNQDCGVDEIISRLSQILPKYKTPTEIKICRQLPLNASGKVDRTQCRAMILNTN